MSYLHISIHSLCDAFPFQEVEVQCLSAKDLTLQCCLELVQQQPEITGSSPIGELSFSYVYLEGNSTLQVNILNAKLVSQEDNKDSMC